jgi:CheY-like chemotaxis protein
MLRDIAVILGTNMTGKPIEVLFDIDREVPSVVVADAMRLQQVLVNLGGNAIKFTAEGQVVLRVKRRHQPDCDDTQQALLEFSIQDSGIGIAPDKQQHIFTGFSQAEASTTRRFGGTGLGLAISKRLVELMGGTLALQSEPGEGSTFSFSLLLPLSEQLPEGGRDAPRLSVEPKRVLVVDDNPVARDILSAMTRSWGWPTLLASSGQQALELVRAAGTGPLDVICLDWQMPEMDGWELARQIREHYRDAPAQPRLVMLSANGRDSLTQRTRQEQAMVEGFLFKPVTASALQDAALGRDGGGTQVRRSSGSRQLAGMRILVVEDNLINQQVAEELLHAEGALVSLAANGQLGVDAVAASQPPFDAVLMDIQMPVLDGYGATRKIREELGLDLLPIVAMTANAMASDRQACLDAGMDEHVGKPFDMGHLVSVLLRVTGHEPSPDAQKREVPLSRTFSGVDPKGLLSNPYLDVEGAVERLSGLTDLYREVLQEFIHTLDTVDTEFAGAVQAGDFKALRAQMHSLKGTSATLGAMRLSEQAAHLERVFHSPPEGLVVLDEWPALQAVVQATQVAALEAVHRLTPTDNEIPTVERRAIGSIERALARAFLCELSGLLRASNLFALEYFARQRHALDALAPADVEELHLTLQALDLDTALQLCAQHIAGLDAH